MKVFPIAKFFLLLATFVLLPVLVSASHSWGNYHWARTSNPFTLKVGDNVSSAWDASLAGAVSDWSQSSVLDMSVVAGLTFPRRCRATTGRVEVCNYRYGNNGWLGLAQIWVSGDHITKAINKYNDTYFNTATYNTPAWRNLVVCQELGHTVGLDHQDESFDNPNLNTCMDYTSNPESNQHPNAHDYEMLETIYAHLDSTTTVGQTSASRGLRMAEGTMSQLRTLLDEGDFGDVREWGKELRNNQRAALFERDFGGGNRLFTFVIWARE